MRWLDHTDDQPGRMTSTTINLHQGDMPGPQAGAGDGNLELELVTNHSQPTTTPHTGSVFNYSVPSQCRDGVRQPGHAADHRRGRLGQLVNLRRHGRIPGAALGGLEVIMDGGRGPLSRRQDLLRLPSGARLAL